MSKFSTFVLTLFVGPGLALAQDRGTIRGTVTDHSGAAVPEADVVGKNVETGLIQTVRTTGDGVYTLPYLPVGNYNVTVEKTGFRKSEIQNVRVDVNSDVPVNVERAVEIFFKAKRGAA